MDYSEKTIASDHDLSNEIGSSFIITDKLLGKGSYGEIYLAHDDRNRPVAIKSIPLDDNGITALMEASIMASVVHPYLNRALRIQASTDKLYIIQDVAKSDLAHHIRKEKHLPDLNQLRNWCFALADAVACLHNLKIIHADIKASNILLYENDTIRLTDFTLSRKKWTDNDTFTHNVCTATHRPLECLLKQEWDEKLDIWSLACTFYEMAYGELLFPYQGNLETNFNPRNKDAKIRIKKRCVNMLIDWAQKGYINDTIDIINIERPAINYLPFKFVDNCSDPEYTLFNNLLSKMLRVNPSKRISIKEVLTHDFFSEMKRPLYLSIKRPERTLQLPEHARITRYIQRFSNDDKIIEMIAYKLYSKCVNLRFSEQLLVGTCVWIAQKLSSIYIPKTTLAINKVLEIEREICHNLLFRLHS